MAYRKYNLNGREMLNLDNRGMVDYDEYYSTLNKSIKRRSDIIDKYDTIQRANMLENEPSINYSVLYSQFLEELKITNPEMYNQKLTIYNDCLRELKEEENILSEEKKQLLLKGYPFDKDLKMYGYYIIKIDNNYFQYKLIEQKNVKINIGDKLFPQNASISSYEFVPMTIEDLQQIKMKILNKNMPIAHHRQKK